MSETIPSSALPPRHRALLGLFFLSGCAGLLYEVLWTRILSLSFGHTTWAVSTVLAVFMGGLALGSAWGGRLADRSPSPLRLYALMELALGLLCLAVPALLGWTGALFLALLPRLPDPLAVQAAFQALLAAPVLLAPTALMGATLPILVRALAAGPGGYARPLSLLYGINTLGAAAGAFLAGYLLLPRLGISAVNLLGVALNLAVGTAALALARGEARAPAPRPEESPSPEPFEESRGEGGFPPALAAAGFALTGAAAMIFQVAWTRALTLVIGSSTYAFSAVLVAVLLGIAAGSLLLTRRGRPPAWILPALAGGMALSAWLLLFGFDLLPGLFLFLFRGFTGDHAFLLAIQFLVAAVVVLIPATCSGAFFPCLAASALRPDRPLGEQTGRFYATNTVGSIAGSLAAGFLLVPFAGARWTLALGILLALGVAAAFTLRLFPRRRAAIAVAAGGVAAAIILSPGWDIRIMSGGAFVHAPMFLEEGGSFYRRAADANILFFREGISSTVTVTSPGTDELYLMVNGKTDASTHPEDMSTQFRLAYFPLLLHPRPRRVAVVGLGSGITPGCAGMFREVKRIEVMEIEPAVVEAAALFGEYNLGILSDPRLRLRLGDARNLLQAGAGGWDVIISEPSNPWISGVSNLYSREFLTLGRERLADPGVFCLWIHSYGLAPDTFRLVVRTFREVFPRAALFRTSVGDVALVGMKGDPGLPVPSALSARLARNTEVVVPLVAAGLDPQELFTSSLLLGPEGLRRLAGPGPVITDDHNRLEFLAPLSLYDRQAGILVDEAIAKATGENEAASFLIP